MGVDSQVNLWFDGAMPVLSGLFLILPVVGGAYLGRWLDTSYKGYSLSWTVNLILLGVVFGAVNVYFFIREH